MAVDAWASAVVTPATSLAEDRTCHHQITSATRSVWTNYDASVAEDVAKPAPKAPCPSVHHPCSTPLEAPTRAEPLHPVPAKNPATPAAPAHRPPGATRRTKTRLHPAQMHSGKSGILLRKQNPQLLTWLLMPLPQRSCRSRLRRSERPSRIPAFGSGVYFGCESGREFAAAEVEVAVGGWKGGCERRGLSPPTSQHCRV